MFQLIIQATMRFLQNLQGYGAGIKCLCVDTTNKTLIFSKIIGFKKDRN